VWTGPPGSLGLKETAEASWMHFLGTALQAQVQRANRRAEPRDLGVL
jgi:hypothetical protein